SSIAKVNAVGGDGSDSFNITPSPAIAYTADGGNQPSGGGDTLQLVPGNSQAGANGSTITIPGAKAINYLNIEKLNLGSGGSSAKFVTADASTQGNWIGTYGSQGYNVIGDAPQYPTSATVTPSGASTWVWATSTTSPSALQNPGGSGRIIAGWYSSTSFTVD